ncbi:MAG: ABC transporter ATP-binding protein [Lachnospiraceae bacterium]|nr:ABC transporter ATP-binding protein [Lachnospiraceae bacterium]
MSGISENGGGNAPAAVFEFSHYGFQYEAQQEPTLYDIDLVIHKGEKVLIAGPSGCGKSTLVHSMNGLIPFAYKGKRSGSLKLFGTETADLGIFEISTRVGTVLQDSDGQFVGMTVAEDIAFALENDCISEPELHEKVRTAAGLVHIEDHLSHAPGELSGGQRQRVAMAGVVVADVDVLLFDEPLANLDPAAGMDAVELIDRLQEETGAAVVIVEHRIEDVLHRAVDRVVLMDRGHIVFDGTPDALLSSSCLPPCGIREPLYIAALRYAGVTVTEEMRPASLSTLRLSEEDKKKVADWFYERPQRKKKAEGAPLLTAEHVSYAYGNGRKALSDVSLSIREGECVAIVGKNGAGKTTFSKLVCGFLPLKEGKIRLREQDLDRLSIKERADHIGYVMQNPNQMISKTMIKDEVQLGLKLRGLPEEEIERRYEKALRVCGIWGFRNWPVSALSFGQRKRMTVASILVLDPEILILDEPTAGQDYRHYTEIMEFLREVNEAGITVVIITHDMHLMLEYADRAFVFTGGELIADKAGAEVLTDPALIEKASLKTTSLYGLALMCGIPEASEFAAHFVATERERKHQ